MAGMLAFDLDHIAILFRKPTDLYQVKLPMSDLDKLDMVERLVQGRSTAMLEERYWMHVSHDVSDEYLYDRDTFTATSLESYKAFTSIFTEWKQS